MGSARAFSAARFALSRKRSNHIQGIEIDLGNL
jgi:hypothetical protein